MARGDKKDYQAATFRLPPGVLGSLEAESARTGLPKSTIVERAISAWIAACSDGESEGSARDGAERKGMGACAADYTGMKALRKFCVTDPKGELEGARKEAGDGKTD